MSKKKKKLFRRQELLDLQNVLKHRSGRNVMWRILDSLHLVNEPYTTDTNQEFMIKGRRMFGQDLMYELNEAVPGIWGQMQQEAAARMKLKEIEEREQEKRQRDKDGHSGLKEE